MTVWLDPMFARELKSWDNDKRDAYLTEVLRSRWAEWRASLKVLRDHGWKPAELHAACDAMRRCWVAYDIDHEAGFMRGPTIAATLHDAEELNKTATRHGVDTATWDARWKQVRMDEALARALYAVVCEWWAGNPVCSEAMTRMDDTPTA